MVASGVHPSRDAIVGGHEVYRVERHPDDLLGKIPPGSYLETIEEVGEVEAMERHVDVAEDRQEIVALRRLGLGIEPPAATQAR